MTMTNDELRALADCLDDPNAMQRTARRKAADYLRAQADAQPVATLTLLDDMGAQIDFRQSFTLLPGQTFSLYAHPAPQAEPKREPLSDEQIDAALQTDPATILAHVEAQAAEIERLTAALKTCVWALRQPLDGWKGECERKALDEARDALKEQR